MHVDSLACVRVKGSESERVRIRLFTVHMHGVMKKVKMGMGRRGVRFIEEGIEWRLPGLLYTDDLGSMW